MKKRFFAGLVCLLVLFCAALNPAAAFARSAGEAQRVADQLIADQLNAVGVSTIQQWIDGPLSEKAGISSEWYILSLAQRGEYDFSAYQKALLAYLDGRKVSSASTRQKYALVLLATGSSDAYIQAVCEDSIGQQGVMSWAYGLHLLNNGCAGSQTTVDEVLEQLLSLQLEDGGWAVNGAVSDADVTSMVLQALAPHVQEKSAVSDAVGRAIELLSARQLEDGGYASYGTPNPESAAQVLSALSCLGIDALQDERFIKNGCTLLDGMVKYRLENGAYSHTLGGASSQISTVQVLFGLTAYQRLLDGKGSMYQFARTPSSEAEKESASLFSSLKELGYKPIAAAAIGAAALLACVLLLVWKKRSIKNYAAVLVIAAVLIFAVFAIDIRSADNYYSGEAVQKEHPVGQVTLTIRCDTVAGKSDSQYIPKDGVILAETPFVIEEGDTVYDILTEAAQVYGIQMENTGGPGMAYIAGLGYLYEYDFGDMSGWIYHVNGESLSVGCDQCVLQDGDKISWMYSCELGNDLT